VPCGGSRSVVWATLLVFTFVALWHDLSLRLLTWGWAVSLFVLPEILARRWLPAKEYSHAPWYRHLAAAGGVANVFMLIAANLIGFAIGTEGVKFMLDQILTSWRGALLVLSVPRLSRLPGAAFLSLSFVFFFALVQVMFEYREEELRQGIVRKC
jgi:hypothetical protein